MLICILRDYSQLHMAQLLSIFNKRGVDLGLDTMRIDINDTTHLSKYFDIIDFNPLLTAGKNPISFNGSLLLKSGSEIKIECIDSNGKSLYLESPKSNVLYSDASKFIISIHVYNETYNGAGKLIFVGTSVKGEIVRWIGNITIDKTLQNTSKVIFYNKPTMEVRSLLYPVVTNDSATLLTTVVEFDGRFLATPILPTKDTNRKLINDKQMDIDYRVLLIANSEDLAPTLNPTNSFNTQMEGQEITIYVDSIQPPFSYINKSINTTASFKIKKIIDNKTLKLDEPFFYSYGKDQYATTINQGNFTVPYTWVAYNTQSDAYLSYTDPSTGTIIYKKESYAEITYRNIRTFSGFVSRHKLYRKSLVYPGEFQLISDTSFNDLELLVDPITNNKSYRLIGEFYNQNHINKYWYTSSNSIYIQHSVTPHINAMKIYGNSYTDMDGTQYVIAKADSAQTINDAIYHPYNADAFSNISGSSYNSNFINLKGNSLYALSTNIIMEKEKLNRDAKVTFYFMSSTPSISIDKDFVSSYGLKIGEISLQEDISSKFFNEKQILYFTPADDYYGTIIIVPYQCNISISELSLKVYGDYGFSPDTVSTKVSFPLNLAGESFQLKSELYDINSVLIYSDLKTIQSFDPNGESLFAFVGNSTIDPTRINFTSGSLTVSQSLFLPNIKGCPSVGTRLLSYHYPTHFPPDTKHGDGEVCFTNIIDLNRNGLEYMTLSTTDGITNTSVKSIAVKYTGSAAPGGSFGRRISIDINGIKTEYS